MVHHTLITPDGFHLSVDSFTPALSSEVKVACVIINATGVQARFYHDFAKWMAQHGVAVCTFDFRYSGTSLPSQALERLKRAKDADDEDALEDIFHETLLDCPEEWALMSHWTQRDLASVVRFSRKQWPARPLTLLGNSLGGHLAALLDQSVTFDSPAPVRILNICGGCAYWKNNANPDGARYAFEQLVVAPLETERVFRSSSLGLGYDLPYGVGKDWLRWYFHPLFSLQGHRDEVNARAVGERLDKYLYVGFEDDENISQHMMHQHLSLYSHRNGNIHSLWIDPPTNKPQPWPKCGHVTSLQPSKTHGAADADGEEQDETGAEGYSCHEVADENGADAEYETQFQAVDAGPHDSLGLTPSKPSPSRLTRQDTIFQLYLDFVLHGNVWTHAGRHKLWRPSDERDRAKLRAEEEAERQKLRAEGQKASYDYEDDGNGPGYDTASSPSDGRRRSTGEPSAERAKL